MDHCFCGLRGLWTNDNEMAHYLSKADSEVSILMRVLMPLCIANFYSVSCPARFNREAISANNYSRYSFPISRAIQLLPDIRPVTDSWVYRILLHHGYNGTDIWAVILYNRGLPQHTSLSASEVSTTTYWHSLHDW